MLRKNLIEKLERYYPEDEIEKVDKEKMLEFLSVCENCFERSLPVGHFTGSCWLESYDGAKFLLGEHKKMKFWAQLGGHADGDGDLVRVALKEAHEESGLKDIVPLSGEIFDIGVHLTPEYKGIPAHYHFDVRFLLRATNENEKLQISDESDDLRWFETLSSDNRSLKRMYKKWIKLRR
ncbi:MAG: NUDIX hydrolase [Holosporaceae bacterium]|jgi:ADP-ribose pyrophosphatase YjhB (NUDIX family)|nr:NUDIX hydrolase [Holosporaceae bacterium]